VPRDPVGQIIAFNQRFLNRYPILLRQKIDRLGGVYAELLAKADSRADEACETHGKGERRIVASLTGREDVFVKRVLAFALAYSEQVEEDHRLRVSRKKEAERALLP